MDNIFKLLGCGLDSVLAYVVLREAIENNIPMMELTLMNKQERQI